MHSSHCTNGRADLASSNACERYADSKDIFAEDPADFERRILKPSSNGLSGKSKGQRLHQPWSKSPMRLPKLPVVVETEVLSSEDTTEDDLETTPGTMTLAALKEPKSDLQLGKPTTRLKSLLEKLGDAKKGLPSAQGVSRDELERQKGYLSSNDPVGKLKRELATAEINHLSQLLSHAQDIAARVPELENFAQQMIDENEYLGDQLEECRGQLSASQVRIDSLNKRLTQMKEYRKKEGRGRSIDRQDEDNKSIASIDTLQSENQLIETYRVELDSAHSEIENLRIQLIETARRQADKAEKAQSEIESLQAELVEARHQALSYAETSLTEIESLRTELEETRDNADKAAAAQSEIETLQAHVEESRNLAAEAADEAQSEIASLQDQLAEARNQTTTATEALSNEIDLLKAQLEETRGQNKKVAGEAQAEIASLRGQLEEAQNQADVAAAEAKSEIESLSFELEEARKQSDVATKSLQSEIKSLQDKIEETRTQRDQTAFDAQAEIEGLTAQLEEARKQAEQESDEAQSAICSLQTELEESRDHAAKSISELENTAEQKHTENLLLNSELEECREKLSAREADFVSLSLMKLENTRTYKNELLAAKSDTESLKAKLAETSKQADAEATRAAAEIAALQAQFEEMQQLAETTAVEAEAQITNLNSQLEETRDQADKAAKEHSLAATMGQEESQKASEEAQTEIESLKAQLETAQKRADRTTADLEVLVQEKEDENDELVSLLKECRDRLAKNEAEIGEARVKSALLQGLVDDMSSQLKFTDEKNLLLCQKVKVLEKELKNAKRSMSESDKIDKVDDKIADKVSAEKNIDYHEGNKNAKEDNVTKENDGMTSPEGLVSLERRDDFFLEHPELDIPTDLQQQQQEALATEKQNAVLEKELQQCQDQLAAAQAAMDALKLSLVAEPSNCGGFISSWRRRR